MSCMARHGAESAARQLCARTSADAAGMLAWHARRSLAMGHWRDSAAFLLVRTSHFDPECARRGFGASRHGSAAAGSHQQRDAPGWARAAGDQARRPAAARDSARGTAAGF